MVAVTVPLATVALTAPVTLQREFTSVPVAAGRDCQAPSSPNSDTVAESTLKATWQMAVDETLGPTTTAMRLMSVGPSESQACKVKVAVMPLPVVGDAEVSFGG
jgi:hypothetical protein